MNYKRIFLIVLDSFGIGELPDAKDYGDEGSNTFKSIFGSKFFNVNIMKKMGLFNIDGIDFGEKEENTIACYGKAKERSKGKDTTTGHWEMAGIIKDKPSPVFPNGFPKEVIEEFTKVTGRKVLCNKPYSGTEVIKDYGEEHIKTGALIVYTSADSVFQIAAHEECVSVEELYKYCEQAREILKGNYAVGRVIARPFIGEYPNFTRTSNRRDFSLLPPKDTMLNYLQKDKKSVISIGKIAEIFSDSGITEKYHTKDNADGMRRIMKLIEEKSFCGLCFMNLEDFDMLYGHRNDVDGYAKAISEFDKWLGGFIEKLNEEDLLIITADHGCDPATPSTDHSREYIPILAYNKNLVSQNLGTRETYADIGKTVLANFEIENSLPGEILWNIKN
ncbi:MAG: phosphopentomutase [Oscillospiraceae bacterium]|nr:phosphopentomutase [Oscillospiraceae bacterium]